MTIRKTAYASIHKQTQTTKRKEVIAIFNAETIRNFNPTDFKIYECISQNEPLERKRKDSFHWYKKVIAMNGEDLN